MPMNYSRSEYPGGIHTPMGVRSSDWIRAVQEDPRTGRDIYPWWEDGLTANFFLGRALYEMWTKVRWRPVLWDEEYDDWDFICDDLRRAYRADPSLNYTTQEGSPVPAAEVLKAMKLPGGDLIQHRERGLVGKTSLGMTEENGEMLLNLKAFSAVDGKAALCNIFYHDQHDYD